MGYEFWLRIGKKYPAGIIDSYLANFGYHSDPKSGRIDKKQFQDELRLAKKYSKDHNIFLLLHRLNYYKITGIYKILNLIK